MGSVDFRLASLERVVQEQQHKIQQLEKLLQKVVAAHEEHAPQNNSLSNSPQKSLQRNLNNRNSINDNEPIYPRTSYSEGQRPRTEERVSRSRLTESPNITRRRAVTPDHSGRSSHGGLGLAPLKPLGLPTRTSSAASLNTLTDMGERVAPTATGSAVRLRTALTSPGMVASGGRIEPPPPLRHHSDMQQLESPPKLPGSNFNRKSANERVSASEPAVTRCESRSSSSGGGRAVRRSKIAADPESAEVPHLSRVALLEAPHEKPVQALVVTPCGTGIVAAGLDGQLHLWSLNDAGIAGMSNGAESFGLGTTLRSSKMWTRVCSQPLGGGEVNAAALSGSILACGCEDGSIPIFRLQKEAGTFLLYSVQRLHHAVHAESTQVMSVSIGHIPAMRQAPLLVTGAQDGSICTWNLRTGQLLQAMEAHSPSGDDWVMSLILERMADEVRESRSNALTSALLISASFDRTIKVWTQTASPNGPQGSPIKSNWSLENSLEGHMDGVISLAISKNRRLLFSGSNDQTVRAWSLSNYSCLFEAPACSGGGAVSAATWYLAYSLLATGGEDGSVILWDVSQLEAAACDRRSNVGRMLGSNSAQMVRVGELTVSATDDVPAEIVCLAPSADGTALFCGLDDGSVAILGSAQETS